MSKDEEVNSMKDLYIDKDQLVYELVTKPIELTIKKVVRRKESPNPKIKKSPLLLQFAETDKHIYLGEKKRKLLVIWFGEPKNWGGKKVIVERSPAWVPGQANPFKEQLILKKGAN